MNKPGLRAVVHRALALAPLPTMRYQQTARHMVRDGVAHRRQDFPNPDTDQDALLKQAAEQEQCSEDELVVELIPSLDD